MTPSEKTTAAAELRQIKFIGPKRAQALIASGITTPQQLRDMSADQLAAIKTVGAHYAQMITAELERMTPAPVPKPGNTPVKAKKPSRPPSPKKRCRKWLRKARKRLKRTDEQLKPLWRRKYALDYIAYKKTAKAGLKRISKVQDGLKALSPKKLDKISAAARELTARLDTLPKRIKRKHYRKAIAAVERFNKTLTKAC